jgi:hypothetical protein
MPTMTKKHRIRLVDPQGGRSPNAGSASRQDRGRWSSRRKTEVVLRIRRGESLDALSREFGISPGRLAEWRDEAIAVSQATSPSAKKTYGIQRVCRTWKLSRATVQRRKAAEGAPARVPGKRGPRTTLDDQALLAEVHGVLLAASPFVGEGYRKVWARLRQQRGIRTSMPRVLRIMREHGLLAHQRSVAIRGPQIHDRTIVTDRPDRMWVIDATGCLTDEGNATVFVLVDHCTGECLGVRAALRGTRFEAIECVGNTAPAQEGENARLINMFVYNVNACLCSCVRVCKRYIYMCIYVCVCVCNTSVCVS